MNRLEIKELAKSKIKGNLWKIIWPVIVIGAVESILTTIVAPKSTFNYDFKTLTSTTTTNMSPTSAILVLLIAIICGIAMIAYKKYILNFTRKGNCDFKDIIDCLKAKWLNIIIAEVVMTIIISLASLLFVIPGMILALAYAMVPYLVVDTDLSGIDTLKKSRGMMKGYKVDYLLFGLSFFGWILLACLTCGILLIWLYPYMEVAQAIYYDKLKEKAKIE